MTTLVALYSSCPQSGKSTFAHALRGDEDRAISFATPLKAMTLALLDLVSEDPVEHLERYVNGDHKATPIPELGGLTSRKLMQTLGTDWGRALDEDLWVRVWEARYARAVKLKTPLVVVDDMRFPNEYKAIKALGGVLVKIDRPNAPVLRHTHASEGALDAYHFPHIIHNEGGIADLQAAAFRLRDFLLNPGV